MNFSRLFTNTVLATCEGFRRITNIYMGSMVFVIRWPNKYGRVPGVIKSQKKDNVFTANSC